MEPINTRSAARRRGFTRHGGFTLVELMLVMTLIAVLVGFLTKALMGGMHQAASKRARAEIKAMEMALEAYKADYGIYPLSPTVAANMPPNPWAGQNWPPGVGPGSSFGGGRSDYYYQQNRWGDGDNPGNAYWSGGEHAQRIAACLWYFLYQAPIDVGKPPYMTFGARQVVQCSACANTSYKAVVDPWGYPYLYGLPKNCNNNNPDFNTTINNATSFDLISAGPNGIYWNGGNGYNGPSPVDSDDITNFESH